MLTYENFESVHESFPIRLKINEFGNFIDIPSMIQFIISGSIYKKTVERMSQEYVVPIEAIEAIISHLTGNFENFPIDFNDIQCDFDNMKYPTVKGILNGNYFNISVDDRVFSRLEPLIQHVRSMYNNNTYFYVYAVFNDGEEPVYIGRLTVCQIIDVFDTFRNCSLFINTR